MKVLVTGSHGFIGKNLLVRFNELEGYESIGFNHGDSLSDLEVYVNDCDAVIHLAGVNRPNNIAEFAKGNAELTAQLCGMMAATNRNIPLILASSTQAALENPYGESKLRAEKFCEAYASCGGSSVTIFRFPGVFGKWCRPNYNSVVATFCHNIANNLPIEINDPSFSVKLVYIDDVVDGIVEALVAMPKGVIRREISPSYEISLESLAEQINSFKKCRTSLISERVGAGLVRALYATYVSYLPPNAFAYDLPKYGDERGVFVEMLKTKDSGQFSFFTAHPGVTRGGHYHHSKTEKFLVIKGNARFCFRNIVTNERHDLMTSGNKPQVVETVPGWTHDITNVGNDEMIVMLWANEIFDRANPDTYSCPL